MNTKVVKIKCAVCKSSSWSMEVTPGVDDQYADDCCEEEGWFKTRFGWTCPNCVAEAMSLED